jgi:hypothetical protein
MKRHPARLWQTLRAVFPTACLLWFVKVTVPDSVWRRFRHTHGESRRECVRGIPLSCAEKKRFRPNFLSADQSDVLCGGSNRNAERRHAGCSNYAGALPVAMMTELSLWHDTFSSQSAKWNCRGGSARRRNGTCRGACRGRTLSRV